MFTKIKNKNKKQKNKNKIKTSQLERIYRNLKNKDLMLHKQLINFFF